MRKKVTCIIWLFVFPLEKRDEPKDEPKEESKDETKDEPLAEPDKVFITWQYLKDFP